MTADPPANPMETGRRLLAIVKEIDMLTSTALALRTHLAGLPAAADADKLLAQAAHKLAQAREVLVLQAEDIIREGIRIEEPPKPRVAGRNPLGWPKCPRCGHLVEDLGQHKEQGLCEQVRP